MEYICKYCGKFCKNDNSLRNHERLCKLNPNRQEIKNNFIEYNRKKSLGKILVWNKGLTKETDPRVAKSSKTLKERYKSGDIIWSHTWTEEGYKKFKSGCSKGGGIRKNAGHGKKGTYKGIYCSSSWELAFVLYHIDNGLNIKRYEGFRTYTYEGKIYKYFPDFITDLGIYEIKGYYDKKAEAKHNLNLDIKMLFYDNMKFYIQYAINKYGKDYIKLYD